MKKSIVCAMFVLLCLPRVVFGAVIQGGEDVFLSPDVMYSENMYLAGGNVSLNSPVNGDVYVAGGHVFLSSDVTEDVVAVGGSVNILGNTGGDVRMAGGTLFLSGTVEGELIVTGGSVVVSRNAIIEQEVIVFGGEISFDGTAKGNVRLVGGRVVVNGHIEGSLVADVEENLVLNPTAKIDGSLNYTSVSPDALKRSDENSVVGETVYRQRTERMYKQFQNNKQFIKLSFIFIKFFVVLMTALLLGLFFKKSVQQLVERVIENPFRALGIGVITSVFGPVLVAFFCATVIGIPLGIMTLLAYALLGLLSLLLSGIVVGAWMCKLVRKLNHVVIRWENITFGTLLLFLIAFIPFVGWLIILCVYWMTLGSVMISLGAQVKHMRS